MKKEDFTIGGSVALKKAFVEESGCTTYSEDTIEHYSYLCPSSVKVFKGGSTKTLVHFTLPNDWDEALEHVKNFWEEETKKSLFFGEIEFICDKETKTADTVHGKVTLEEIDNLINYVYTPPKLAGYALDTNVLERSTLKIKVGCAIGGLGELEKIADFLRGYKISFGWR